MYKVIKLNRELFSRRTMFTGSLSDCLEGLAHELNNDKPETVTIVQAMLAGYYLKRA